MSSKKKLFTFGFITITLMMLLIINSLITERLKFEIIGEEEIYVDVFSSYKDLGAKASIDTLVGNKKDVKVSIKNKVDSDKVGNYFVTYGVHYNDKQYSQVRIVHVVDEEKPEIKISGEPVGYCKKAKQLKTSLSAIDNYDGDITDKIKTNIKDEKLILEVADSSNNISKAEYKINYLDEEKPNITLAGNSVIYLNIGEEYHEYGASAYDSCDGDITKDILISNNINNMVVGTYQVLYKVKDSSGIETSITRDVVVKNQDDEVSYVVPTGATIYLTFDDGPGPYTAELLDILDKYNIKATFFVTNQFPKYQYMIKEEYRRGHKIGIHTYSHLWSIYTSVNDYMNDFNLMNKIVYDQTGVYSKIFRFPGGSSNKVSAKYNEGIMTKLADKMVKDGYQYYDWNIDSTDTHKGNTSASIAKNMKSFLKGNKHYIVLMHDIKKNTIKALPEVIEYAKTQGYQFSVIDSSTPIVHSRINN